MHVKYLKSQFFKNVFHLTVKKSVHQETTNPSLRVWPRASLYLGASVQLRVIYRKCHHEHLCTVSENVWQDLRKNKKRERSSILACALFWRGNYIWLDKAIKKKITHAHKQLHPLLLTIWGENSILFQSLPARQLKWSCNTNTHDWL